MFDADSLFVQLAIQRGLASQQAAQECVLLLRQAPGRSLPKLLMERAKIPESVARELFGEAREMVRRAQAPHDLSGFLSSTDHDGGAPSAPASRGFGMSPAGAGHTARQATPASSQQGGPGDTPNHGWQAGSTPPGSQLVTPVRQSGPASSPVALRVGAVFNRYRLESELGRGGMGIVWKARQIDLDRNVAVKMLLQGALANVKLRQRFVAEAKAVARLLHANVVTVHDVGEQDGILFFTMDFVDGPSLAQYLKTNTVGLVRALEIALGIAEGLDHAHNQGIVHRDLKPANILIDPRGQPRITDFGIAKDTNTASTTQPGEVLGTPSYMAPEQADGGTFGVDGRADVYSLGAVLYRMLTGEPPFTAESAYEVIKKVVCDEVVPPRKKNGAIPRDVEELVLRCLEKDREQRVSSAAEVARVLRRILSRLKRDAAGARSPAKGSKAFALVLLVTGICLFAGVGLFAQRRRQEETRLLLEEREAESRRREAEERRRREGEQALAAIEAARQLEASQPQEALTKAEFAAARLDTDAGAQTLYGRLLLELRDDPRAALGSAEKAIALDPKSAKAYELKGRCLLALQRPDREIETLARQLERLDAKPARAAAAELRCDLALSKDELSVAIVHLDQAVRNQPEDGVLRLRMVRLLVRARRFASAAEEATKAIRLLPEDPAPLALRARARLELDRTQDAKRDVKAALALDPEHELAREVSASLARIKPQPTPPVHATATHDPEHVQVHKLLERTEHELRTRHPQRARALLQQAYEREPKMSCPGGLSMRLQLSLALGMLREGQADLETLRALRPDDSNVREIEAKFALRMGKTQTALNILSDLIQERPGESAAYASRSQIYEKTGDLPRALEDLNQAVVHAPGHVRIQFLHSRAHLLLRMSRHTDALNDAQACLQHSPQSTHFLLIKGECLQGLDRAEEAAPLFEAVLAAPKATDKDRELARARLQKLKDS